MMGAPKHWEDVPKMVEVVARALCSDVLVRDKAGRDNPPTGQYIDSHWHLFAKSARTALAAAREPTCAMKTAGWKHISVVGYDHVPDGPDEVWRAMIDAALEAPKNSA